MRDESAQIERQHGLLIKDEVSLTEYNEFLPLFGSKLYTVDNVCFLKGHGDLCKLFRNCIKRSQVLTRKCVNGDLVRMTPATVHRFGMYVPSMNDFRHVSITHW